MLVIQKFEGVSNSKDITCCRSWWRLTVVALTSDRPMKDPSYNQVQIIPSLGNNIM